MQYPCLQSFIKALIKQKDCVQISAEVDPYLELAEIHRRVIAQNGPALLFTNVKSSKFPVVTNLFGTQNRVRQAFGNIGPDTIAKLASHLHEFMPPTVKSMWNNREPLFSLLKTGIKKASFSSLNHYKVTQPNLNSLPVITSWPEDGGPFFTLPLVYTEHPVTGIHNLGMYRLQRFSDSSTGLHMQIGKGGGFHLNEAARLKKKLPINVFLGGPPAAILSAISPLPENIPELFLASLMLGKKINLLKNSSLDLPLMDKAEFVLSGYCNPQEKRAEGPFGDHYGYYSLTHDFPVFHCNKLFVREKAIYPATIVGKPRQEDFFIGNYLQEMLSPLFPIIMPGVKNLWSYGETGFHSLTAAIVSERYNREAMMSAFRILGEGQLSFTKFLLVTNKDLNLQDFKSVLPFILERCDFKKDLYIFSHLAMDTLDYTGPSLNNGSKAILLGLGNAIRELPKEFNAKLPLGINNVRVFCPGCLVISGNSYIQEPELAKRISNLSTFSTWPLIVIVDNASFSTASEENFLWTTFTRFEPAQDIHSKHYEVKRNHIEHKMPIVIDARMKPGYPGEVETDTKTQKLVDSKWKSYFPKLGTFTRQQN